ncbi:MAG: hypothetical protein ACQEVA_20440, partial [Myxococcota bacterium]
YDESVPEELVAIIHKACHQDKEQRFQSAEAFKNALEDFLHHRESVEVSREAEVRLERLAELMEQERGDDLEVHDLFGECRFGFRQALRMWPGNVSAEEGLRRCLALMARYYLDQENLAAARNCLAELDDPPDDLLDAIDALQAQLESERQELERLKRFEQQFDLQKAMTSRSIVAAAIGVLWSGATLILIFAGDGRPPEATFELSDFTWTVRSLLIVLVPTLVFRKRLFANMANRRLIFMAYLLMGWLFCIRYAMYELEASVLVAQSADTVLYGLATAAIGIMSDRRIVAASLVFVGSLFAGIFWPVYQLYFMAAAGLIFCLSLAWIWRPGQKGG